MSLARVKKEFVNAVGSSLHTDRRCKKKKARIWRESKGILWPSPYAAGFTRRGWPGIFVDIETFYGPTTT